ncbi:MAG: M23/M56 family metallopeptidase [Pseudomonadota bacterium]
MNLVWLVLASFVWTGLLAAGALWITAANVRPHFAQGVWRGAAALMVLPWFAAFLSWIWPSAADVALPALEALPAGTGAAVTAMGGVETALSESSNPALARILAGVIVAGWLLRLLAACVAQIRLQRLKATTARSSDEDLQAAARWADALGLSGIPFVRRTKSGSPFVAGVKARTVYLPKGLCPNTSELVIAHECVHLSRRDLISRPLERAVADLLWFSPFAWIARERLDYYREAVCDAETVSLTGERTRYARTLAEVARAAQPCPGALPVSGFIPRAEKPLTARVKGIVNDAPPRANHVSALLMSILGLIAAPLAIAQGLALDRLAEPPFTHPVVIHAKAKISSAYGFRTFNDQPKMHRGVDVAAPEGTPVFAPISGKISHVEHEKNQPGYGNSVSIRLEDGSKIRFASLDKTLVEEGDVVWAGDTIGTVGSSAKDASGPHVHIEIWRHEDDQYTALDPVAEGLTVYRN